MLRAWPVKEATKTKKFTENQPAGGVTQGHKIGQQRGPDRARWGGHNGASNGGQSGSDFLGCP